MKARSLWLLFSLALSVACTPSGSVKTTQPAAPSPSPTSAQKRPSGIDFVASGPTPSWSLEIDFGKEIKFYTLEGITTYAPVPAPTSSDETGQVVYEAHGTAGNLTIRIAQTACPGDSSTQTGFNFGLEVIQNGKKYEGCGHYLFDAMSLHDIWALEAFEGKALSTESFLKGAPMLELFPLSQRFMGNSGCNQLSGRFELESDRVRFSNTISTKMACPGNFEATYLNALQTVTSWRRTNGMLILLKEGSEVMTFRKID